MRDSKMELSMVHFLTIQDVTIRKKLNEHGTAVIKGIIDKSDEESVLSTAEGNRFAKLSIENEKGKTKTVFAGIVESVQVASEGNLKQATVKLVGATRLLECASHTRTFQNKAMTYGELVRSIETGYDDIKHIMHIGSGQAIGDMIVQYKENDWDFLKRLASHFHARIYPGYGENGIRYHFGLLTGGTSREITSSSYQIVNDVDELYEKKENKVPGLQPGDGFCYKVQSREYLELGEKVTFRKHELYVYAVQSAYIGNELVHTYYFKTEGGCKRRKCFNTKLIGASLDAKILSVSKDTVKVCVTVDGKQDKAAAKWFPYSTVYSSPDGTGWYCMPEEGDKVRLYFPNEKEEEGYIISSIHLESGQGAGASVGQSAPRSNPDNKSISTKYNKQVELTPTTITMTNNKGMTIKIDDKEGISIHSDKNVTIQSDEELSIRSRNSNMVVEAPESIAFIQGSAKITMKDEVTVEGAKFKVQ